MNRLTVGELIQILQKFPAETAVLRPNHTGQLIPLGTVGTAYVIPSHVNQNTIPGNEWRVPVSWHDEPETERETVVVIK